jgi:hypothetical protein
MRHAAAKRPRPPEVIILPAGPVPQVRRLGMVRGMMYALVPGFALWLLGYFLWRLSQGG